MMSMFKTMIIIIGSLTLIGVVAIVLIFTLNGEEEAKAKRSIDEIVEASLETEEITTNLKDGDFIKIRFRIVTSSEEALEELQKRDFQMKNILIKQLAQMEKDSFQSKLAELENTIQTKLNEVMEKGEITGVYTTEKVLQ